VDGQPLPVDDVDDAQVSASASKRIRFTETGYNSPRMLAGEINPRWLALESAHNYRVNEDNAYVELKREAQQGIENFKERAALNGEWVLAALPTVSGEQLYVLARRDGTWARVLDSAADHPEAPELWQALESRFGQAIRPIQSVVRAEAQVESPPARSERS
jgi:hypothetical protein